MDTIKDLKYVNENLKFVLDLLTEKQKQKEEKEQQKQKEEAEKLEKYKSWAINKYNLTFFDIREYLDKMEKEANKKKDFSKPLPMGLTSYEQVIKFKCYDNEILDVMIKNDAVDIETITKELKFICDYQKYLIEEREMKDCVNWQMMLNDKLLTLCEDVKFLNSLKK